MVDYSLTSTPARPGNQPMYSLIGHLQTDTDSHSQDTRSLGAWHLGHLHIFNGKLFEFFLYVIYMYAHKKKKSIVYALYVVA